MFDVLNLCFHGCVLLLQAVGCVVVIFLCDLIIDFCTSFAMSVKSANGYALPCTRRLKEITLIYSLYMYMQIKVYCLFYIVPLKSIVN